MLFVVGCKSADPSTHVPLTLRNDAALVVVDIDGHSIPVILDSGYSGSIALTEEAIQRVKAVPIGGISRGMDVKGNILERPRFKIPRIQIGTAVFSDVVAELDVHDPSYPANQIGQQGFLGTALLKPYQVVLDYPHRRMTLMIPRSFKSQTTSCEGTVVSFSPAWHGEPVTAVKTDLGQLVMWWDTGAPLSLLSTKSVANASNLSEGRLESNRLILGDTDFGPWTFETMDMSLPPGFDGFIGDDFFANHVVCMDFPGQRLFIRK